MSRSAGRIGWILVWAVVFCDIGTSLYYVPGLLYASTGDRAGFFVAATMLAFVFLCIKEVEITRRFPGGGGVVSLSDRAFGPWFGALGGQLIMVDFFLTVAISAVSGVYYIDSIWHVGPVLAVTLCCLAVLCILNIVGIKESAGVSLVLAVAAFLVDIAVVGTALLRAPPEVLARIPEELASFRELGVRELLVGYAGAWLAFAGLEAMSQLAPAMRDLGPTPRKGMTAVAVTVILTAPLVTFLSTASLPLEIKAHEPERFMSELAAVWGGHGLKLAVVLSASSLLLFAANTAIIGNYHVMMALVRREFLPPALGALSHRFQTPYRAIVLCTLVPAAVLIAVQADILLLGELYAFGLLGSFVLSSTGIDSLRWKEGQRGIGFWLGVATSVAVLVAFVVNLFAKEKATLFGGILAAFGMAVALGTRTGWIDRVMAKIPRLRPPSQVERFETPFFTVEQAAASVREGEVNVIVASRGATRKIFKEAVDRARARGLGQVYAIYVDEIPGLFYPQLAAPTPEGLTVLEAACAMIESMGMKAVPVWALSHAAAVSVAEAAEALRCDTVVIGATQRTIVWTTLRGKFIQEMLRQLPPQIRLIVVG
ncbi:MAG: APC family permease [Deltaproteobacteria bacterium]|nr:APC family permease [Deltaproteobacteria bacterium]